MNESAKEIFFKCYGSHSLMDREGVYDRYKRFGISKEQEKKWLSEMQEEELKRLRRSSDVKTDFCLLCVTERKSKDKELFFFLYNFILSDDADVQSPISRLYMINAFVDVMRKMKDITDINVLKPALRRKILKVQKVFSGDVEVKEMSDALVELLDNV